MVNHVCSGNGGRQYRRCHKCSPQECLVQPTTTPEWKYRIETGWKWAVEEWQVTHVTTPARRHAKALFARHTGIPACRCRSVVTGSSQRQWQGPMARVGRGVVGLGVRLKNQIQPTGQPNQRRLLPLCMRTGVRGVFREMAFSRPVRCSLNARGLTLGRGGVGGGCAVAPGNAGKPPGRNGVWHTNVGGGS